MDSTVTCPAATIAGGARRDVAVPGPDDGTAGRHGAVALGAVAAVVAEAQFAGDRVHPENRRRPGRRLVDGPPGLEHRRRAHAHLHDQVGERVVGVRTAVERAVGQREDLVRGAVAGAHHLVGPQRERGPRGGGVEQHPGEPDPGRRGGAVLDAQPDPVARRAHRVGGRVQARARSTAADPPAAGVAPRARPSVAARSSRRAGRGGRCRRAGGPPLPSAGPGHVRPRRRQRRPLGVGPAHLHRVGVRQWPVQPDAQPELLGGWSVEAQAQLHRPARRHRDREGAGRRPHDGSGRVGVAARAGGRSRRPAPRAAGPRAGRGPARRSRRRRRLLPLGRHGLRLGAGGDDDREPGRR